MLKKVQMAEHFKFFRTITVKTRIGSPTKFSYLSLFPVRIHFRNDFNSLCTESERTRICSQSTHAKSPTWQEWNPGGPEWLFVKTFK